jgi:hypothetical protein
MIYNKNIKILGMKNLKEIMCIGFKCLKECSSGELMLAHRVGRRRGSTFSLGNRLTDGGKVVSLRRRPLFISQEDSWFSYLLEV